MFEMLSLLPLHAEPLKPMTMKLNSDEIMKIPLHSRVQTLLLFPEPVTLLIGEGVTDGQSEGKVQAQLAEDKRVVVLRSLEPDSTALMQVMVGTEAYAFRLYHDDQSASIIRFPLSGCRVLWMSAKCWAGSVMTSSGKAHGPASPNCANFILRITSTRLSQRTGMAV